MVSVSADSAALLDIAAVDVDARETARSFRNELLLVAFTATTNIADAVTRVALPLLAATLTNSPGSIAAVVVVMSLPWLVTALHVGVMVDRMNRRSLMLVAEATRTMTVGVLLAAVVAGVVTLPLIYALAIALGVAEVVAMTAGASIVPAAVIRSRWQSASARITATEYLCNGFVGAPIGGFLVAAGFAVALGTTGAVYLAGAVMLLLLVGSFRPTSTVERRSIHAELRCLRHSGLCGRWAAGARRAPVWLRVDGPRCRRGRRRSRRGPDQPADRTPLVDVRRHRRHLRARRGARNAAGASSQRDSSQCSGLPRRCGRDDVDRQRTGHHPVARAE